jgi:hypothetical protein
MLIMEREQAVALAQLVRTFRRDWDALATVEALVRIDEPLPIVTAHALTVAADRQYRTPAALGFVPIATGSERNDRGERPGDRRSCDICGRSEWACGQAQRNTGLAVHEWRPEEPRPAMSLGAVERWDEPTPIGDAVRRMLPGFDHD